MTVHVFFFLGGILTNFTSSIIFHFIIIILLLMNTITIANLLKEYKNIRILGEIFYCNLLLLPLFCCGGSGGFLWGEVLGLNSQWTSWTYLSIVSFFVCLVLLLIQINPDSEVIQTIYIKKTVVKFWKTTAWMITVYMVSRCCETILSDPYSFDNERMNHSDTNISKRLYMELSKHEWHTMMTKQNLL